MTIEEILAGESQRMEFKESLPEKSHKYMKTVVAFANGKGGKLVFGVADQTNEITGIDDEKLGKWYPPYRGESEGGRAQRAGVY